jgi:hypothetical protein
MIWGAFSLAGTPAKPRETLRYRCDLGRNVTALQRENSISVLLSGRNYDLTWVDASTARGQGLEWRVREGGASLKRISSGHAMVSGCVRR